MFIPSKEELIQYNVDYSKDTEFSAYARLLQSKWREKKGFQYVNYGNLLEVDFAKIHRANYLTENIKELVTKSVLNSKRDGAMIGEPRIWNNLLSSQPLCFNLFGELHYDLELASNFFNTIFPERVEKVTEINFEYSAGRGDKKYTGDHSAFDVFVKYSKGSKNGFIGIEVKYAESLWEETKEKADETFKRHLERYTHLTKEKYFKTNSINFLRQIPLSQIWRDHLLTISHLKDYDEGFFVFLFPKSNNNCQESVDEYKKHLICNVEEETVFYPRYLDDFIMVLNTIQDNEWTRELKERYIGND